MKKSSKEPSKDKTKKTIKNEDLKNISGGRRRRPVPFENWRSPQDPSNTGGGVLIPLKKF